MRTEFRDRPRRLHSLSELLPRDRRIWVITCREGYVTTCVGVNPLALRLRQR